MAQAMNSYLFSVIWQLAMFGLLIAAAVAAYLIAKGLRLLLFSGIGRSSVSARLFSLAVGFGVLTLLTVLFSFVMDRAFALVLF